MFKKAIIFSLISICAGAAHADYYDYSSRKYEVTVVNITKGQFFTPILSATHKPSLGFFDVGEPASEEIEALAESGNIAPLREVLTASDDVQATASTDGLLAPGGAVTFELDGARYSKLSLAAMLIPTNDTFVAIDSVRLPHWGARTYYAKAYDAGTENNDELCANIPGPRCQGAGLSDASESDEGYIYISPGIHGEGDLSVSAYDWRDVVAKVTVRRIK